MIFICFCLLLCLFVVVFVFLNNSVYTMDKRERELHIILI